MRSGVQLQRCVFHQEFVVRLPEGETLDFGQGYIQVDVPTTIEYKDIDITAHPEHHLTPTPSSRSGQVWVVDLKMVTVRAYSMANHPAGQHRDANIRIATPPWTAHATVGCR